MAQRVLLVNKFYYPRGGDCVVTLNTERLLRAHGVDVGVYAMQYPHNVESQFSRYFASQISLDGGLGAKLKALMSELTGSDTDVKALQLLMEEL